MAIPRFPQKREWDLLTWSSTFSAKISAAPGPGAYGLTPAQAFAYATLHAAFASAYAAANNSTTNSQAAVGAKNQAKRNLLDASDGAHKLVDIVQAFPGTANAIRGELGLRLRGFKPAPVQSPDFAPDLHIIATIGRTVKVRIRGRENPDQRGKPAGCDGATVLFHCGETTSAHVSDWNFALNTARTVFDVHLPATVPAGSKVWLTAFWFNKRKQPGPPATAKSTRVIDALAMAA